MRITAISVLAIFLAPVTIANAITLYEDPATGQIFTRPGEGRVALEYFPGPTQESADSAATAGSGIEQVDPPAGQAVPGPADLNNGITILDPKSPEFPLGKETQINMKFVPQDASDMWFKAGVRVQGTMESSDTDFSDPTVSDTDINDAYLRRARLEVGAGFGKHTSFTMDIRSDRVNQEFRDEGEFKIGDAYLKISKPFDTSLVNFKIYRAKIDISRTETVKSAYVVAYDRPKVADAAAQFISFNRRAANVQVYGDWNKKFHYQLAVGDATVESELEDAIGASSANITDQSLFYGGKVILSPFDGWEEIKKTETYMGQGKHFSVGAAYWSVPTIEGENEDTGADFDLNHELINLEASGHYKGFFAQSEYFKFKDRIEDFDATELNVGESEGWYVTSEYVMPDFYYIAPFARYENWNLFEGESGYKVKSALYGVNWYLRGNTTKIGVVLEKSRFGENIGDLGKRNVTKIRLTSQFFF